jgi:two-component system, OmpR family, sensor histidine kinase BaeS
MRWSLSYRVRAIVLVALLACAAIAVTAWVSARSTVTQLSSSEDSRQNDIDLIASQLTNYGLLHGSWVGVAQLTLTLEQETSQRIKLTTQDGQVIVDTDNLHGRTARETSGRSPVAIVPRPTLELNKFDSSHAVDITMQNIEEYRSNARMAACLTQAGLPVSTTPGANGIANIVYDAAVASRSNCVRDGSTPEQVKDDVAAATVCLTKQKKGMDPRPPASGSSSVTNSINECLSTVFQQRTAPDDAVTLLLYVGFRGAPTLHVKPTPILYTAIPIVLLAILFAGLLSRHVLRPVDAVIHASRRLEAGHRKARVPERGHDEMAMLARSFNRMVDSVQASDAQQRQMVADIAHELRTPLANIRGYLEALKDGVLAPTTDIFESLHEEALLQQRIIDDLQDLALADRDRLIDHRIRTDLGDLVRTARAAHAARADAASITLSAEADDDLYVDADPDRLRQALGNLLTNALRATGPGGRIAIAAARADRDHVTVTIADSGHGITPEHVPHIFDRFWRADPSRARGTGGSGLGLAITNAIVRGHGGTVMVDSAVGVGTTFTVTLPASSPSP